MLLAVKHEVPHLLKNGGVIVCTASSAAEQACPNGAAYTAGKHAVPGIVQTGASVAVDGGGAAGRKMIAPPMGF